MIQSSHTHVQFEHNRNDYKNGKKLVGSLDDSLHVMGCELKLSLEPRFEENVENTAINELGTLFIWQLLVNGIVFLAFCQKNEQSKLFFLSAKGGKKGSTNYTESVRQLKKDKQQGEVKQQEKIEKRLRKVLIKRRVN